MKNGYFNIRSASYSISLHPGYLIKLLKKHAKNPQIILN